MTTSSGCRLCLNTLSTITKQIASRPTVSNSVTLPSRPFTNSPKIKRHATFHPSDSLLAYARGGKALQELLDGREEEKEEEDNSPVVTQLDWESPLQVLKYPDPRLRAPNARIACFDNSLRKLAEELFELMYEYVWL